ncbi:hypothetical protein GQ44DRAFT_314814 [Phaeosphaeriaceae sp. PMI808]|nr:hypothetical protein GQ44DRAFT_314814 [Phaeosphaeriaceae sp. PMI808]
MHNRNGFRIIPLVTPSLFFLFPVCIITFALERVSKSLIYSQTQRNFRNGNLEILLYGPTSTGSTDLAEKEITLHFDLASRYAILGTCSLALLVSVIGVFGIWELRRVEGTARHARVWSWVVVISNVVMIGVSVGILGYMSSVQSSEKRWQRYEDVGKDDQEFTRETWACQVADFYTRENWAGPACRTAKTVRYMLIPMAISAALALVSLSVLVRDRGGLKWLVGGKGRYAGFDDAYEMQPTPPNASYVVQTTPQWAPQQYQQWSPVPAQNWAQQPIQPIPQPVPGSHVQEPDAKTGQQHVFK